MGDNYGYTVPSVGAAGPGWATDVKAALDAIEKAAPMNSQADLTGGSDVTADVHADLGVLKSTGGKYALGRGTYRFDSMLDLDDFAAGLIIEGQAAQTAGPGGTTLLLKGSGSGPLIRSRSSSGVELRNLRIIYDNASYTGDLIQTGQSALAQDTSHFKIKNCYIGGLSSSADTARSLVSLPRSILVALEDVTFGYCDTAIRGVDGFYCNVAHILRCNFQANCITTVPIWNAGINWTVEQNTFGQRQDGKAAAYDQETTYWARALKFDTNYFEGVGVDGGTWFKNLRALSLTVLNQLTSGPGSTGKHYTFAGAASDAVNFVGNRMEAGINLDLGNLAHTSVGLWANSFQGTTGVTGIHASAVGRAYGNSGFADGPLNKATITGSRGSNAALANLLATLHNQGELINSTSA